MANIYKKVDMKNLKDPEAPQDIHGFLGFDKWHRTSPTHALKPINNVDFIKIVLSDDKLTLKVFLSIK